MALLSTLDNAKSIMGTVTGQITTQATIDNDLVLSNLRVVTQRINNRFPNTPRKLPMFEPYFAAVKLPLSASDINSGQNVLRFPGYLLELTGVNVNGTAITAVTDVDGFPDASQPPFSAIQLTSFYNSWYAYCGTLTRTPMITVTGWWGFSTDYATAWAALTTLSAAVLTTTVTTITVTDVDADGLYGYGIAISAGNLIRIDDELMEVLATVVATNVVTVRRGVNGSTAATHLNGASVEVWQVEESVARACARQAGLLYRRFGAYTTSEITPLGSEIKFPSDWLQEVYSTLQSYQYI